MRRIALTTAIVFLTLALIAVAWQLRSVVLVFVISLVISATVEGPIVRFGAAGLPRRWAILAVYLCAALIVGALVVVIAVPIVSETNLFVIDLTQEYNALNFYLSSLTDRQIDLLDAALPTNEQFSEGVQSDAIRPMVQQAVGITQNVGTLAGQFLLALVLSIYWSVDRSRFERFWLSLLVPDQRARMRGIMQALTTTVGAYIRSELLQMFFTGTLLTLGFWLAGLKYPFTAAMLAALGWLIPLVGGLLALLPVLLIGWMSGPTTMIITAVLTVCVLLVMEFMVERRLFGEHRYWGILLIFVVLALGSEFGVIGLLIAPPVAVALQIIINTLLFTPVHGATATRAIILEKSLPDLRRQLSAIQADIAANPTLHTPRLENLAQRIQQILAASEALPATLPAENSQDD